MPGLRWHLPYPIEMVDKVNVTAVDNFPFRTEMLTADRRYVFIQMVVQYRRTDPVKYSFEVVDPESTVQDVTERVREAAFCRAVIDRAAQGNPGKYTFCFAERDTDTTWAPLAVQQGMAPDASAVTLFCGAGVYPIGDQLSRNPDSLARSLAATLRTVYHPKIALATDAKKLEKRGAEKAAAAEEEQSQDGADEAEEAPQNHISYEAYLDYLRSIVREQRKKNR